MQASMKRGSKRGKVKKWRPNKRKQKTMKPGYGLNEAGRRRLKAP